MNKAKIGGILSIVSGVIGFATVFSWLIITYLKGFFTPGGLYDLPEVYGIFAAATIFLLVASSLAMLGGISATKKRRWGLALAGGIFSMIIFNICGIPSLIFNILAKEEFNDKSAIPQTLP